MQPATSAQQQELNTVVIAKSVTTSVVHFWDQHTSTLYMDNGYVARSKFHSLLAQQDVNKVIEKLEIKLKERGVIKQNDNIMYVC